MFVSCPNRVAEKRELPLVECSGRPVSVYALAVDELCIKNSDVRGC